MLRNEQLAVLENRAYSPSINLVTAREICNDHMAGVGGTQFESFPTEEACFKRLDAERHAYEHYYVVRAAGCFPRELIVKASEPVK